jgi:hypothetical protein
VPLERSISAVWALSPAATQSAAELQDTLQRIEPPAGVGVRSIDQWPPVHRSATDWWVLFVWSPTAVHSRDEAHDTPFKVASGALLGFRWIDHVRPFHRSTSGRKPMLPTAMHDPLVHETALSIALSRGLVAGVSTVDQTAPFQRATSALERADRFCCTYPTATHRAAELHDTPLSTDITGDRTGASWTLQRRPFQPIASAEVPP